MNLFAIRHLLVLLLLCSLWLPLRAQVIIKDTVVISPFQINELESGPLSSGTDTFFIVPQSGVLAIRPYQAFKWRNPLPTGTILEIQVPQTTYNLNLLPLLPPGVEFVSPAYRESCRVYQVAQLYCYNRCFPTPIPQHTFYTGALQTGDTVRFAFYGQFYNPTRRVRTWIPNNLWDVWMYSPPCNESTLDESCELYISYADTVVNFITPDTNVYPTYSGRNNTPATRNYVDLELRVSLGNDSVPNAWVRLDTAVLVDSGGHSHDGARPMGRYIVPKLTGQGVDTIISGTRRTDSTGVLRFKFLASHFGGVERIRASLVSNTTKWDTLNVKTKVPALVDFALIQSNFWENVGNSGMTNACDTSSYVPIRHYSNHWATQAMVDSLQLVLLDFYIWSGSEDVGGQYIVLKINDMSLEKGGSFDIRGDWNMRRCHVYHRIGLSVDINNTGLKIPKPGNPTKRIWTPRGRTLKDFMVDHSFFNVEERHIHFEFER